MQDSTLVYEKLHGIQYCTKINACLLKCQHEISILKIQVYVHVNIQYYKVLQVLLGWVGSYADGILLHKQQYICHMFTFYGT